MPMICLINNAKIIDGTYVLIYNKSMGTTILGRRLSNSRGTVNSVYIETSFEESSMQEDMSC